MNPAKTQIKIGTITELGVKYDDMREALERDVFRKEGYQQALNEIQQSTLKSIFARVDDERDSGRFDIPTSSLIKEYLVKVHAALDNLRGMNERHRTLAEGRVAGLRDAIAFAKKMLDAERAKLVAVETQVGAGVLAEEATGAMPVEVRPDSQSSALEDLQKRRARAKVEKAERVEAETVALTETVTVEDPLLEVAGESVPRRRGRPKGSKNRPKEARA